jgi:hypothetical protein
MTRPIYFILPILTLAIAARQAHGLDIEFEFLDGFAVKWPEAAAGLERAAANWEARLADPVTVRIDVAAEPFDISQDAVALADVEIEPESYAIIRAAMAADATSADDLLALANLPPQDYLTFRTHTPLGEPTISTGVQPIREALAPARALSKALGLPVSGDSQAADGLIKWNESLFDPDYFVPFDYDPTDGVVGIDFVGTATHEIGHVLGFYSGVDEVDLTSLPEGPWAPLDIDEYAILRPLDLFRYSAASLPYLDAAPGGAPYFSIDGGATDLALFHTGEFNGDGLQASHWKGSPGVMSTTGSLDEVEMLTALDLRALDVIGWDLRAAPEPTTCVLALSGIASSRVIRRRRLT